ncbi:MAG: hypothetical protein R8M38_08225, partial [Mariprofundaceae bacterium]
MSLTPITVSNTDFQMMLKFSRLICKLKHNLHYVRKMKARTPKVARFNSQYSSVLMGFDFHLTSNGPKLIEINNNAAGLLSWKT